MRFTALSMGLPLLPLLTAVFALLLPPRRPTPGDGVRSVDAERLYALMVKSLSR